MFTKKLEDQFSADLLNTVNGILGEAKKCPKDCECEKCEKEEKGEKEEKDEMKEANLTGLPKSTAEKNKQYIEITHQLGHKRRVPVHPTNAYKALNRYRKDPSTKSARIVSEEAEQLDELSPKTLSSYAKKAVNQTFSKGVAGGMGLASSNKEDEASGHRQVNKAAKRMQGAQKAISKLTKEEQDFIDALNDADIDQIAELSTKTLDSYRSKARKDIIDADANDDTDTYNKRTKGYTKASRKIQKNFVKGVNEEVELEEGRGRPPKEGSPAWHAKQKQANDDMVALGMQLRKAKSMNKKVRFMDNKEHEVSAHHADRFEDHMAARKTSQEKAAFQKQAHKSHADFVKAVTAPVPKASKDTGEIVKYRH